MEKYKKEEQISLLKSKFAKELSGRLHLIKVEAPLLVEKGTGVNDDLNGIESPVSVSINNIPSKKFEIVHSLAKWKREKLAKLGAKPEQGIYTDMRAIRTDEVLTELHSVYVDQWDWEKVISSEDRNLDYLKATISKIYESIKSVAFELTEKYGIVSELPQAITYLHTEDVLELYPNLTAKERENEICKKYGAVFLIGIGGVLADGKAHDGRASDYDDWSSETSTGYKGLNGDLLLWNPVLNKAIEISSMGIRVDKESLLRQLQIAGNEDRKNLDWHKALIDGKLPQTIGGGIGQSRLAMFLLWKRHIGEVQSSVWNFDKEIYSTENQLNIL
jgi:aspartate--ammonia ligase